MSASPCHPSLRPACHPTPAQQDARTPVQPSDGERRQTPAANPAAAPFKTCATCGATFADLAAWRAATQPLGHTERGRIEWRNCTGLDGRSCGSTHIVERWAEVAA